MILIIYLFNFKNSAIPTQEFWIFILLLYSLINPKLKCSHKKSSMSLDCGKKNRRGVIFGFFSASALWSFSHLHNVLLMSKPPFGFAGTIMCVASPWCQHKLMSFSFSHSLHLFLLGKLQYKALLLYKGIPILEKLKGRFRPWSCGVCIILTLLTFSWQSWSFL